MRLLHLTTWRYSLVMLCQVFSMLGQASSSIQRNFVRSSSQVPLEAGGVELFFRRDGDLALNDC